ncbi:MAG: hypothetical protein ACYCWE_19425 [Eubacteriales bacterium]
MIKIVMNITGTDRKNIAEIIGKTTKSRIVYKDKPSYAYYVGDWIVNMDSQIISPEFEVSEINDITIVLNQLYKSRLTALGDMLLMVNGLKKIDILNLKKYIEQNKVLLSHALGRTSGVELLINNNVINNGDVIFPFYNATLNSSVFETYILFTDKIIKYIKTYNGKLNGVKDKTDEYYTMRDMLNTIDLNDDINKSSIDILLSNFGINTFLFSENSAKIV